MPGRGRPKGYPKSGGRKKGTPNKATLDVKARIDQILDSEQGWKHVAAQFERGELPVPVLLRLIEYRIGKPKDALELSGSLETVTRVVHEHIPG